MKGRQKLAKQAFTVLFPTKDVLYAFTSYTHQNLYELFSCIVYKHYA